MLWPAAIITFRNAGARSITGIPSYVIGRQPYHSLSTGSQYGARK